MKRKMVRIIFLLLLIPILVSCSSFKHGNLNICFKSDKFASFGSAAAVYNDRIYYISNELGDTGIYSMNLDGSDNRIELKNPSVTSMQIIDDKLYFTGLREIAKIVVDHYIEAKNKYSLFDSVLGSSTYKEYPEQQNTGNIIGFYLSHNEIKLISCGNMDEILTMFDSDNLQMNREGQNKETVSFYYDSEAVKNDFYSIDDLIIAAQWFPERSIRDKNFHASSYPYVIDTNTGELVFKYITDINQKDILKAFCMDEKNIYCSYNEMIVILNASTFEVKQNITPEGLSQDYIIEQICKLCDDLYFIADRWSENSSKTPLVTSEKLYKIDTNTFELFEILELDKKQRILGLDDNYIILYDNGEIYRISFINGVIGEKTKLIDTPTDFYIKNYTIDYAGDWMFIYKTYPEKGSIYQYEPSGQQLLYKINLQSGEVIKNKIKLEFSKLDSYREK